MSLASLLVRFAGLYVVLMALLAIGFAVGGLRSNAGMNVAALAGAVIWPCLVFGRRNGRPISGDEKRRVVLGMVAIDLAIQLASGLVFVAAVVMDVKALLTGLAIAAALHAVTIYLLVTLSGWLIARQLAARAEAGTPPIAGPNPASPRGPSAP
jgi:hypothetical protein